MAVETRVGFGTECLDEEAPQPFTRSPSRGGGLFSHNYLSGHKSTNRAPAVPAQPPGASLTLPIAQDPMAPGATSPCPSDAAAGLVFSSPWPSWAGSTREPMSPWLCLMIWSLGCTWPPSPGLQGWWWIQAAEAPAMLAVWWLHLAPSSPSRREELSFTASWQYQWKVAVLKKNQVWGLSGYHYGKENRERFDHLLRVGFQCMCDCSTFSLIPL